MENKYSQQGRTLSCYLLIAMPSLYFTLLPEADFLIKVLAHVYGFIFSLNLTREVGECCRVIYEEEFLYKIRDYHFVYLFMFD